MTDPDFCNINATFMIRLLNGHTYSIGCEHRNIALVTQFVGEDVFMLTLELEEDQDVAFEFRKGQVIKTYQGESPKSIPDLSSLE